MKLIYTPDAQEPQEWTFEIGQLSSMEAELIEEAGGTQWTTFAGWLGLMASGGWRAWRVTLWLMLRRVNPDLDLNQVQPEVSQIAFDANDEPASVGKDEPGDMSTDSESPNAA